MGTKNSPGKYDCYENALPDEPMFVLLARDPSAPYLVRIWANEREAAIRDGERPQSDQAMIDEALKCAKQMTTWRKANEGKWRNKVPSVLGKFVIFFEHFRHKKRQTTYGRLTDKCELQLQSGSSIYEGAILTIYRSEEDGSWWARTTEEFNDGRFERLES